MTETANYRVVVVDDHALFRRGLVDLLSETAHLQVVAQYDSGRDCIEHISRDRPELLLLDLQMPGFSGLDTLKSIPADGPRPKVVVLTASADSAHLLEALRLGAQGYLMKDTHPEEILGQLDQVLAGQIAMSGTSVTALAKHIQSREINDDKEPGTETDSGPHLRQACPELTEREEQTLMLIARGLNNKLIARELGISDNTVKVYVKSLLRKLGLHSRLELAAWVHQQQSGGPKELNEAH
ncbi:response regulator [Granulosicoccaceae sp. 1_MG-2023]|nr:response regulator [Granulosicoccaceae sp. 1_MG-2023]